jgi:hypothetical protein
MERVLSTLESTAMTRLVHCGLVVLIRSNSRSMSHSQHQQRGAVSLASIMSPTFDKRTTMSSLFLQN